MTKNDPIQLKTKRDQPCYLPVLSFPHPRALKSL